MLLREGVDPQEKTPLVSPPPGVGKEIGFATKKGLNKGPGRTFFSGGDKISSREEFGAQGRLGRNI